MCACAVQCNIRERPFNLKGGGGGRGGGGGYVFFLKKYSDFGGGKKKFDSEFLSYNVMLNSGKKIRASSDKKNKYSNSCVVRKKNSERNKKP